MSDAPPADGEGSSPWRTPLRNGITPQEWFVMPALQRKSCPPALSERDIFLIIRGIAASVQCADEECAYGAFMHLMERIESCPHDLALKARLFAQALIKAVDPSPEDG